MSERRRTPKYAAIAEDLTTKIHNGEYAPGTALPGQHELSAHYGVTLMTLRQALRVLADDGLISQEPGRGTFVRSPTAAYRLESLRSIGDDLRAQGLPLTTRVIHRSVRALPVGIADILAAPGGTGLRLERVREIGGRPAVHQVSWVPAPHGPTIRDQDFTAVSLYEALASVGAQVHTATERLIPVALPAPVAALLDRPPGTPTFQSNRTTHAADGTPLVHDQATILGDLMEIRTERSVHTQTVHWTPATP
ncbi:GntR family transcriptional regulator [Actinokineospora sp. NBRC 105648]|uniref:GntR family transcriptional regulator n=1 Tax=Actinokineospora sp. NBRC 105648 TaxID=3032206 RepID=UPI0024A04629|nr:GntR family transcriptional regulator [Actinokineospora sp. NBRC 105648]GLZ40015.1 HTH-type transcriptional repressor YvoA [Actinokineospora sp. NBRC 105648]